MNQYEIKRLTDGVVAIEVTSDKAPIAVMRPASAVYPPWVRAGGWDVKADGWHAAVRLAYTLLLHALNDARKAERVTLGVATRHWQQWGRLPVTMPHWEVVGEADALHVMPLTDMRPLPGGEPAACVTPSTNRMTVSLLPGDVGFDPRLHGYCVLLPWAYRMKVLFLDSQGRPTEAMGSTANMLTVLRGHGYICEGTPLAQFPPGSIADE